MNHAIIVLQEQLYVLADLYERALFELDGAERSRTLFQLDREMRETRLAVGFLMRAEHGRSNITASPAFKFKLGQLAGAEA